MGKRLGKQTIVERFIPVAEAVEIDQTKLPEGISFRATYPICNIGEMNRNKRRYRKEVWEKVDGDPDIQEKLKTRSLFGHAEHPKDTSQSSTEKISHVVTNIFNEGNIQKCTVEGIKGTPYGDIVYAILRAKCGLGMSTRAEGDLEECEDESGTYYDVIPEAYSLKTVDFTADPSTYGAYPESVQLDIVDVVKKGIDNEKIDRQFAAVLLESLKIDTAKNLRESIVNDKGHKDCKCKKSEKKCSHGCQHANESKVNEHWHSEDIEPENKKDFESLSQKRQQGYIGGRQQGMTHVDALKAAMAMQEHKDPTPVKYKAGLYEFAEFLHGEGKWVRNGVGEMPAGSGFLEQNPVMAEGIKDKVIIRAGKDAWLFAEAKVNEVGEYVPCAVPPELAKKASDKDKAFKNKFGKDVDEIDAGAGGGPSGIPQGKTGSGAGGDKAQAFKADAARVSGEAPFREGAGDGKYAKQIKQAYANWQRDFPKVQADADDIFNDVVTMLEDGGYTMTEEEKKALYKEISGEDANESRLEIASKKVWSIFEDVNDRIWNAVHGKANATLKDIMEILANDPDKANVESVLKDMVAKGSIVQAGDQYRVASSHKVTGKVGEAVKTKDDIIKGITDGTDEYFGYAHFDASNMADYTLMSSTIEDMVNVYGIGEHDAADIIQALTHGKNKNEAKMFDGYAREDLIEFKVTAEKNPVRFKRMFSPSRKSLMDEKTFRSIRISLNAAIKTRNNEAVRLGEANRKLTKEVQIQMGEGTPILNVVMDVEVSHEHAHGADADGKGGTPTDFIEDVTITSVRDSNGKDVSITPEIKKAVDDKLEQMDMAELEENKKGEIVMKRRIQETKENMNTGINFEEIYAEMQKASEDAFLSTSEKASLTESKTAVDFYKNVAKVLSEAKRATAIATAERDKTLEIVEAKIKEIDSISGQVKTMTETIAKLKEQSAASIKAFGEKLVGELKGIYEKKMEGIKAAYEKKLKEQKAEHAADIFQKTVVDIKIRESGLELPENAVALIRQCKTSEEVDTLISKMRFALKESLHHSGRPGNITVDVGDGGSGLAGVSETERLIKFLK